ncbi:MAG: amidohydrolase family protein [Thermoanaerobaculia bacterium]|nr:amidohydrolase family protein [Thermoanaerobaculia bacterium]
MTVIDPESRSVLPDRSIHIANGRIRAVEPADATAAARRRIDGTGLYVVPGLIDLHVHLTQKELRSEIDLTLALLLAHGVTGVRDMAGDCWEPAEEGALCRPDLRRVAREIEKGRRAGPRLLSLSSAIVRGAFDRDRLPAEAPAYFAPADAEEGRRLARYLKRRGVSLAKVYNTIPREAYFALAAEARELNLEVSGHLPFGVSLVEASDAGQRTIEHSHDLPIACGSYSEEYRDTMERVLAGSADPPDAMTRLRRSLEAFDEDRCRQVLATLVANGTILVQTHGTREMDARAGEPAYRDDPRMRYIAPALRASWHEELDPTADMPPELSSLFAEFYELGIRLTGTAHAAGVRVLVGTDANDTMIFPGSSLHDELARFAQAGLEPMDILRAATTLSADYLGRSHDLGGVAPGKLADLVLLSADPLEAIENSRRIETVVVGGRVHDRGDLDNLLATVAARVEALEASVAPSR